MSADAAPDAIDGVYFDGRSARGQAVQLRVQQGRLHLHDAQGPLLDVPVHAVRWPERLRHGQRQLLLPEAGVVGVADGPAFDAWAAAWGRQVGLVERWQQSWAWTLGAAWLAVALLASGWRWGLPWAAEVLVHRLPPALSANIGDQALASLDRQLLSASELPAVRQAEVQRQFADVVARATPVLGAPPPHRVLFRRGTEALGPNAFALPGGHLVLTDALVTMLEDQPAALSGVLAHELGHVQHAHGLRLAVQSSVVGVVAGLLVGDVSSVLATVPTVLLSLGYSRDFEREADAHARTMLEAAGLPPSAMVAFFEQLEARRASERVASRLPALPIGFSSHPADAERIAFFRR